MKIATIVINVIVGVIMYSILYNKYIDTSYSKKCNIDYYPDYEKCNISNVRVVIFKHNNNTILAESLKGMAHHSISKFLKIDECTYGNISYINNKKYILLYPKYDTETSKSFIKNKIVDLNFFKDLCKDIKEECVVPVYNGNEWDYVIVNK
jgi:hypothetical protein